jgi:hypothetical protein
VADKRKQMTNDRTIEFGGVRGFQPLRAVGSIYEPEAIAPIGAYTPEGSWKNETHMEQGNL